MTVNCGFIPERVSREDPRLAPMFDAIARVDRRALGFTPIESDAIIRIEWAHRKRDSFLGLGPTKYDAMLHVSGKTSRTVAFKRVGDEYEWIGEQEIFDGPRRYDSVDGTFNEAITITYDRVPISGFPLNTIAILYTGDEPDLAEARQLSLADVRPWLKKWGYN
jgi:hypothetical protein